MPAASAFRTTEASWRRGNTEKPRIDLNGFLDRHGWHTTDTMLWPLEVWESEAQRRDPGPDVAFCTLPTANLLSTEW